MPESTTIWVSGITAAIPQISGFIITWQQTAQGLTITSLPPPFQFHALVAIPSPSILLGNPVKATSVLLRFKTINAQIYAINLTDGVNSTNLSVPEALTSTSISHHETVVISPPHHVQGGLVLDLSINNADPVGEASMELVAVGIEFES